VFPYAAKTILTPLDVFSPSSPSGHSMLVMTCHDRISQLARSCESASVLSS
jgi:hypothetical protein